MGPAVLGQAPSLARRRYSEMLTRIIWTGVHYEDIAGWFEKTGGPYPPWSTEQEGDFLNYDQILQGWERFLQA